MSRRGSAYLVVGIAACALLVAGSMTILYGAWPILPFAGLEIVLLVFAVRHVQNSCDNREVIDVGERHVDVTRRHGDNLDSFRFVRAWTRIALRQTRLGNLPDRLEIGSHGKLIEIGSFLTDDERYSLANELAMQLGRKISHRN